LLIVPFQHSQERAEESVGHLTDMNAKLSQDFDKLRDENAIMTKKACSEHLWPEIKQHRANTRLL